MVKAKLPNSDRSRRYLGEPVDFFKGGLVTMRNLLLVQRWRDHRFYLSAEFRAHRKAARSGPSKAENMCPGAAGGDKPRPGHLIAHQREIVTLLTLLPPAPETSTRYVPGRV